MGRSFLVLVAAFSVALGCASGSALASRQLLLGVFDDANTLNFPAPTFSLLKTLGVQVVRISLVWGGRGGVANSQPQVPTDPADPAYDWSRYDRAIEDAQNAGIEVLLTIVGTPQWANGGQGPERAPSSVTDLYDFAYAAATRYSGTFADPKSGLTLPRVQMWLAWNEPNNPVFLAPQFTRVNGKWRMAAAVAYAKICNAVFDAVHATTGPEQVACGATAPRGNNDPTSSRPSISPIAFLRAAKAAGLRTFDAWAHHPYYGDPNQTPATRPPTNGAIELGNIGNLIAEVLQLYGQKPLWITEYGYQTNPPNTLYGVSWSKQAAYLRQAYLSAQANPHISLFTWFLLRDNPSVGGWQSGLITAAGRKKPSFATFEHLRSARAPTVVPAR